ncbi:ensconsin isoform X2 [Girardinichthys multiradiatus]|uniref:ensconsin isoform X2 n=1 Tax=Girardinichthys multiradiatus TaxID=208333 RepID=UPI001FAD1785|nr:ensconsin isoform X2 [Girardinichthys multiradiatus]
MPGSIPSMAVQKKQNVLPPSQGPLSTCTFESRRVGNRSEGTGENGSHVKPSLQTKKTTCSANKSIQICNNVKPRVSAAGNGPNVDERLKAARERREEQQRLLVSRELSRLEREQQARRYYEQQLQERRRKLLEQRLKEERRRAAVEEKRKRRLREEKERHETAVRRTIERSQKFQQHLSQSSRGRKPTKNAPRHLPLTPWERNLVSRLLTPTCSYLARSKSAACGSGEEASCHPNNAIPSPTIITPKLRHQSVSVHRGMPAPPCSNNSQQRNISPAQMKTVRQQETMKKIPNSGSAKRSRVAVNNSVKLATSTQSRTASSSTERSPRISISRQLFPLHIELPAVPEEDAAVCVLSFSDGNTRPASTPDKGQQETLRQENLPEMPCLKLTDSQKDGSTRTATDAPLPPEVMFRPSAGTTDPKEASRLLAEKRREARIQREKEEQERLLREEAERRNREEQEHRRAEEQARPEAEAKRLLEEKRRREEEDQRKAEEERVQARREAALLQKQREEESAKERARAEQIKQEREIAAQKEEAERQARKKRLEEIMRRTRRTDSPDMKSVSARTLPKENTEPPQNGTIEDAAKMPVGTKTAQLGLGNEDDMVPVVAFKERRSLRALSGMEEIQTKQRAEVI